MSLLKTWRWFGPNDSITLSDLRQMDVEGVVTSLHHIPAGEVWSIDEIKKHKKSIENAGLTWSVVESLPVTEGIKTHDARYDRLVSNYLTSLKNLGECGLEIICYNFMPVLDWARTELQYRLPSGGEVMLFDPAIFAAFDIFILKRPSAELDYSQEIRRSAEEIFSRMTTEDADKLAYNIIVFTQGFIHGSIGSNAADYKKVFLELLGAYRTIDREQLRKHLGMFLDDILPTSEKYGIAMCIHPDDPPFPLLGLPRIVSTKEDLSWIFNHNPSASNGFTYCSGSLSARRDNPMEYILESFKERVHFIHLRNTHVLENGSFYERGHIDGDVNFPALIKTLLTEQKRREREGLPYSRMPVRPDHGIKMLDDYNRTSPPGYPLIGRMRGLAEIKGIEAGIEFMMDNGSIH
jgi:mannonate dehydratase